MGTINSEFHETSLQITRWLANYNHEQQYDKYFGNKNFERKSKQSWKQPQNKNLKYFVNSLWNCKYEGGKLCDL